jgi:hypothetical protein
MSPDISGTAFAWSTIPEWWTAFATVLLTIVTACLGWLAYRQVLTTRAQLRAYVFVSSAKVTNVVDGDGMAEAHVMIKNSGQTPAYEVAQVGGFAIDRYPPPPTLDLSIRDVPPSTQTWLSAPATVLSPSHPG